MLALIACFKTIGIDPEDRVKVLLVRINVVKNQQVKLCKQDRVFTLSAGSSKTQIVKNSKF